MAYVNYVREHTRFIKAASDLGLSGNERSFWYALMDIANERANGSDWPEELISINNKTLLARVPFTANKIPEIRNKLKQCGLIDFESGKKNKLAAKYKINYFFPELSTRNQPDGESYHNSCDKNGNKDGNKDGYNNGNKDGRNFGNFNVNLNDNPNRNPNACEEDDHADADMEAYCAMRACVVRTFRENFGRDALPAEIRLIAMTAINLGMEQELVVQAIGRAANRGVKSPATYAAEIMDRWEYQGVHTVYDMVNSESMT